MTYVNIPGLGEVEIGRFLGEEGRKKERIVLNMALNPDSKKSPIDIANHILANILIPPRPVEDIAALDESSIALLIDKAVDKLNTRKEYNNAMPDSLTKRERFYQAYYQSYIVFYKEIFAKHPNFIQKTLLQEPFFHLFEDLTNLLMYHKEMEAHLKQKQEVFENLPVEDKESLVDTEYDYRLYEAYPDILRQGLFITCWSFFENKLISLCRKAHLANPNLETFQNFKEKHKHKHYSTIKKAKRYLSDEIASKITSVQFHNEAVWTTAYRYNEIRNAIIHKGSIIQCDGTDIANRIHQFIASQKPTSIKLVSYGNYSYIKLNEDFCNEVITYLWDFFIELHNQYQIILAEDTNKTNSS